MPRRLVGQRPASCASLSRRLFGRISGQFCSMYSRQAARSAKPYTTRQPAGTSANSGQRLCCSSSLTSTKKRPLSSSNGLALTRSPNHPAVIIQGQDRQRRQHSTSNLQSAAGTSCDIQLGPARLSQPLPATASHVVETGAGWVTLHAHRVATDPKIARQPSVTTYDAPQRLPQVRELLAEFLRRNRLTISRIQSRRRRIGQMCGVDAHTGPPQVAFRPCRSTR